MLAGLTLNRLAGRVGAVGSVQVAPSLWQTWVPSELCKRYHDWESHTEPELSKGRGVKEMLEAIQVAGGGGVWKATGDK